ncbi:MAG: hypothetical protein JOZ19_06040 [Rubrobacter sp.]|nr:hypothetical protein [Rubrobacter sp.]
MTTADAAEQSGAAGEGLLARHSLIFFFIIAYADTWLVELPFVRFADSTGGLLPFSWPIPFPVAAAVAPFSGSSLTGFVMASVTEGRAGVGRLLRKIVLWWMGLG